MMIPNLKNKILIIEKNVFKRPISIYYLYFCMLKRTIMATASKERFYLELPSMEVAFLRTLAKKMGWTIKREHKSGIQLALDDVEAGRVHEAKNVDDLMEQLNA